MSQRTTRSKTISNDEIDSKRRSSLPLLFSHRENRRSSTISTDHPSLYFACQNNDLTQVKLCLKVMKPEEIDCQYPPNNETALHAATRNQHKEIIRLLLLHGAQRSLRNCDSEEAHELAKTEEIKDLFKRSQSSRFTFLHRLCKPPSLAQRKNLYESCSLFNDNTFYEWELVDRNASQKALRFRHELQSSKSMSKKDLKQKLYSIQKGYINTRLGNVCTDDDIRIHAYFNRALLQQEPQYIVTAYTICQKFSELLNTDMARNVIHDLKNGCSKFSCDCLYLTEDGTKSITNILLHHPKFAKLSFKGKVYRGIVVPKNALDHYDVGSCIITTTLLSTSKNPTVARTFCEKGISNPSKQSFFCIYEILNDDRTALDISTISEYEDEEEVIILPYSAFRITKIDQEQESTIIYLEEQCLTQMFDSDKSFKSVGDLLKLVGESLAHSKNEMLPPNNDDIRPRSKTMPAFNSTDH